MSETWPIIRGSDRTTITDRSVTRQIVSGDPPYMPYPLVGSKAFGFTERMIARVRSADRTGDTAALERYAAAFGGERMVQAWRDMG